MKRIISTAILAACVLLLQTASSVAETIFQYQVDYFEVTGNGLGTFSDDFNDGVLFANEGCSSNCWRPLFGTVTEADGVVTVSNPGEPLTPPGGSELIMERSDMASPVEVDVYDGLGDFVAESIWVPIFPLPPGGYYSMAMTGVIGEEGSILLYESVILAVADLVAPIAQELLGAGASGGLQVTQIRWTYEWDTSLSGSDKFGDGTVEEYDQYSFLPPDLTGDVVLRLSFDDTSNEMLASFSLDGGETFLTPFSAMQSSIVPGSPNNFMLSGDPMHLVPEPSSVLMLASGLVGLAVVGRKRARK